MKSECKHQTQLQFSHSGFFAFDWSIRLENFWKADHTFLFVKVMRGAKLGKFFVALYQVSRLNSFWRFFAIGFLFQLINEYGVRMGFLFVTSKKWVHIKPQHPESPGSPQPLQYQGRGQIPDNPSGFVLG